MLYTRSAGPPVVLLLIFVKAVRHEDKLDAVNIYVYWNSFLRGGDVKELELTGGESPLTFLMPAVK